MIQWMHRISQSWVASLLMGGLALSFMVWGIADVFVSGGSSNSVATVGNTAIGADVFQRDYQNLIRNQSAQTGAQINSDEARRLGYDRIALQQLISRTALDNLARSFGIVTSDAEVSASIRAMDAFKGPLGTFDHNAFLMRMQAADYTEDSFIATMREDMNRQQLTHAVETGFAVPNAYAGAIFMFLTERRAADYFLVTSQAVGAIPPPGDAALAAYVKSHAAKFSTPEYRDISYAMIAPSDILSQVTVSDDQVKQQYDAHKADYVVPEKREIEQIEFKSEAEAKAARAKINSSTGFETLAAGRGLKNGDIQLGVLTREDLPDADRASAAFALAEGAVSAPVKSSFGWVLMRVTKITPGVSRSLDDVKDKIRQDLATQLAASKLVDIANAFQDAMSGGANLGEAAKKVGMHSGHLAAVDARGLGLDGKPALAPPDPEFLSQAFKAEIGEDGDPFPAKSGTYYAIRVNGSTPPRLKPLDQVRADAIAAWISERRDTLLAAKAATLAAQSVHDKSLDVAAKSVGAAIKKSPALSRGANATPFNGTLTEQLFNAPAGGIIVAPDGKGDFVVARVTGITHAMPDITSPLFRNGIAQLSAEVAGDLTVSLANAARASQGVKVNQALVDSTVGGGS